MSKKRPFTAAANLRRRLFALEPEPPDADEGIRDARLPADGRRAAPRRVAPLRQRQRANRRPQASNLVMEAPTEWLPPPSLSRPLESNWDSGPAGSSLPAEGKVRRKIIIGTDGLRAFACFVMARTGDKIRLEKVVGDENIRDSGSLPSYVGISARTRRFSLSVNRKWRLAGENRFAGRSIVTYPAAAYSDIRYAFLFSSSSPKTTAISSRSKI